MFYLVGMMAISGWQIQEWVLGFFIIINLKWLKCSLLFEFL